MSKELIGFKKWIDVNQSNVLYENSNKINELIKESFEIELNRNQKIGFDSKFYLNDQIKILMDKFNPIDYYGPFTTVCQASGFGKSRACYSLVDVGFYVVYCCLRLESSSGYPKRSCLADFLLSNTTEQAITIRYKKYFNTFIDLLNENRLDPSEFFKKFNQENNSFVKNLVEEKKCDKNDELSLYKGDRQLVFVFDEASSLLESREQHKSNFFILRSLITNLKKNIFVLFLDTFSSLSEFMPNKRSDPSLRVYSGKKKVFEPIYLLPNWDVFLKSAKNISETVSYEYICNFGRVLWGSWVYTRNNSNEKFKSIDYSVLYSAAASKLVAGEDLNKILSVADCLAILSSRIGIIKPKLVSTCQELVAKNMAVCTFVDTETGRFEIDYPSEPILAEAAAYLMHKSDNLNLIIENLRQTVESSLISQGDKGETIAKLILIIAKDKAHNSNQLSYPLMFHNLSKVGEFIQSLYGKCSIDCGNSENGWLCESMIEKCAIKIISKQIENYTQLLNGWINFNHFVKTKFWLKEIDLVNGLKRCAAIHCRQHQPAIDFIIPVALSKNNFESITCIMVQVKLENQASEPKNFQVFNKINSKLIKGIDLQIPSLLLYMQLGAPQQTLEPYIKNLRIQSRIHRKHSAIAFIYSHGISKHVFPHLNNGLDSLLINFGQTKTKYNLDRKSMLVYENIRFCAE